MGGEFFVTVSKYNIINGEEWTKCLSKLFNKYNNEIQAWYISPDLQYKWEWNGNESLKFVHSGRRMNGKSNLFAESKIKNIIDQFPGQIAINICNGFSGQEDDVDVQQDGTQNKYRTLDILRNYINEVQFEMEFNEIRWGGWPWNDYDLNYIQEQVDTNSEYNHKQLKENIGIQSNNISKNNYDKFKMNLQKTSLLKNSSDELQNKLYVIHSLKNQTNQNNQNGQILNKNNERYEFQIIEFDKKILIKFENLKEYINV